jgi:hypothetical protein
LINLNFVGHSAYLRFNSLTLNWKSVLVPVKKLILSISWMSDSQHSTCLMELN